MFLKSLTLKGFKSFADPTSLDFEPGVTVVVGPNGSGKSNIVDAIAWVLGAQGPSVVRSAKMDDVIFAGTEKRSSLGRAEVTLVIDNSARRLAVDLNEVSIRRTLFRSGESEYAMNGSECRLLDVQELLSDTGVGRTQHVIVGQGQLDSVLQARPEDRRAMIEEAAGILKYRRRRERAERRLEASEVSLARVQDLLREVGRQIRPLERQASSARRHAELERELSGLRLYVEGRELAELAGRLAVLDERSQDLGLTLTRRGAELESSDARIAAIEDELGSARAEDLSPVVARLEQLAERTRGYLALVHERRRSAVQLALALEGAGDPKVELERVTRELEEAAAESEDLERRASALAIEEARVAEQAAVTESRRDSSLRAAERVTLLMARQEEVSARLSSTRSSKARLATELDRATAAAASAEHAEAEADQALSDAEAAHRLDEEARYATRGRVEALETALDEARARAGVAVLSDVPGVVGTLLDVVEIDEGLVAAFEAAVEPALDAVLVEGGQATLDAIARLREAPRGGKILSLVAPEAGSQRAPKSNSLRAAVRTADPAVAALLDRLIGDVEVLRGAPAAVVERVLAEPGRTFVTEDGDRFSPDGWRIGATHAGATRAALEAARVGATEATAAAGRAADLVAKARRSQREARALATEARRLVDRLVAESAANETTLTHDEAESAAVSTELERARALAASAPSSGDSGPTGGGASEPSALVRQRRELDQAAAAAAARRAVLEERRLLAEGALRERQGAAQEPRREVDDAELELLSSRLGQLETRLVVAIATASAERDRRLEASRERLARLGAARRAREDLERALSADRERHQRVEIERAEARIRHEAAVEQLHRDFDVTLDEALAAPAPALPEGVDGRTHANALQQEIDKLGPVNPLAAEELAALEERRFFLDGQLEDVRKARRELNSVIAAVDKEIIEVFTAAYADVERNFTQLVAMLFPGGAGRLELVEPEDLLSTGVEIEVNPAGRRVRRMSLLSGGERSLVALGFLFAVFRSRPSPFYVLDEVEAALDDVNLGRFLGLVDEFRDDAQLLIVSHQKRTMEVADALYGISMQPGGASKVVSERVAQQTQRVPVAEAS